MSQLVTTLRSLLAEADLHFHGKRPAQARTAYEGLLESAQERGDHPMAVTARCMLARIAMQRRATDEARSHLADAAGTLDPNHFESHTRYRAALARLSVAEGPPEAARAELRHYLDWAESNAQWEEVVDAGVLLAENAASAQEGREWLERAIDAASAYGVRERLGHLYTHLAALHEVDGQHERALDAHQSALAWNEKQGSAREIVASCWAVGASALAVEDWPLARAKLEQALQLGESNEDCRDLMPLALSDLAAVQLATGDEIEARRLMLRAMDEAKEQDLATFWPERWSAMVEQAHNLDRL
ncbi:MAG: hypothetical protein KC912_12880 [Proteobacteria bacterium]|nr:hypothetical protein [Pseudomonadota bacterium]